MATSLPLALSHSTTQINTVALGAVFNLPNGNSYRLVLNADGAAVPRCSALTWVSRTAYTVERVDAATEEICGFVPTEASATGPADSDYFLMQIGGKVVGICGDHGTAIAVGDGVGPDDDADSGKLSRHVTAGSTFTEMIVCGQALTAAGSTDAEFDIQLIRTLN